MPHPGLSIYKPSQNPTVFFQAILDLIKLIILTITNMYYVPRVIQENKNKAPRKEDKEIEREGARADTEP